MVIASGDRIWDVIPLTHSRLQVFRVSFYFLQHGCTRCGEFNGKFNPVVFATIANHTIVWEFQSSWALKVVSFDLQ